MTHQLPAIIPPGALTPLRDGQLLPALGIVNLTVMIEFELKAANHDTTMPPSGHTSPVARR